jgi:branched-chain amino acid transport system substrate-binding protein
LAFVSSGFAQTGDVKVGLIAPMSGPWARQGDLMLKGAQLAVDDINAGGGIKALKSAKLKLIVYDAGDSVEKAKNTAQRMIALESDLIGATGAWLSSFTLGVTEVTERAEMSVLTLSYSDLITARGSSTCSRPLRPAARRPPAPVRRCSSSPKARLADVRPRRALTKFAS